MSDITKNLSYVCDIYIILADLLPGQAIQAPLENSVILLSNGMATVLGMVTILGTVIVQGMGNIIAMVGVDNRTPYIYSNLI